MSLEIIQSLKAMMAAAEAELQKVRKEMQVKGREALEPAFIRFLSENPDIAVIRWEQYTAYFNDGDECRFRLRDLCLEFTEDFRSKHMSKDFNMEDAENEQWCEGDAWYVNKKSEYGQSVLTRFKEFESMVRDESLFKAIFGDHIRVKATKDGFTVDNYKDHH